MTWDWYFTEGAGIFFVITIAVYYLWHRRRMGRLKQVASMLDFSFQPKGDGSTEKDFSSISLFNETSQREETHVMSRTSADGKVTILDLTCVRRDGQSSGGSGYSQTVVCFKSRKIHLPFFVCRPEGFVEKVAGKKLLKFFGRYSDIHFPENTEFSSKHLIYGKDEAAIRELFRRPGVMNGIDMEQGITVEGDGDCLIVYRSLRIVPPEGIGNFFDSATRIFSLFSNEGR